VSQEATTRRYCAGLRRIIQLSFLAWSVLATSQASGDTPRTELEFANRINEARKAIGLPALQIQAKLTDEAQNWSNRLRDISGQNLGADCKLSHNPRLADITAVSWKTLGENVACTEADVAATHQALMDSPEHRKNILDPKFDSVGVAITITGNTMFVTQVFMESNIHLSKPNKARKKGVAKR
jgi:uncharacterized protein YkwD